MGKHDSEEKEPKPKKLFQIQITVWDDLETDAEMYEFRENPSKRGRPGKWRLKASDFVKRVGEVAGDYDLLLEEWSKAIGKGLKDTYGFNDKPKLEASKIEIQPTPKEDAPPIDEGIPPENFDIGDLDIDEEK